MKITDIKIRKIYKEGIVRAIMSVTLDDSIALHDVKILQLENRLCVGMPSKKTESGFRDIIHPIDHKTRQYMEDVLIKAYHNYIELFKNNTPPEY